MSSHALNSHCYLSLYISCDSFRGLASIFETVNWFHPRNSIIILNRTKCTIKWFHFVNPRLHFNVKNRENIVVHSLYYKTGTLSVRILLRLCFIMEKVHNSIRFTRQAFTFNSTRRYSMIFYWFVYRIDAQWKQWFIAKNHLARLRMDEINIGIPNIIGWQKCVIFYTLIFSYL